MTVTPVEAAEQLAKSHRAEDEATEEIYFSFDEERGEIQMVEVSGSVGPSGEVVPFRFAERDDVPFPTVLVLLSPGEWEDVQNGAIDWPRELNEPGDFRPI